MKARPVSISGGENRKIPGTVAVSLDPSMLGRLIRFKTSGVQREERGEIEVGNGHITHSGHYEIIGYQNLYTVHCERKCPRKTRTLIRSYLL